VKPSGKKGLSFAFDLIPLGLEYIAAYIEPFVDTVRIVDLDKERESLPYFIDLYRPDLVGITMSATDHRRGLRLAEIAKERGIATIVGGYHPTSVPGLMLSYPQVDMVVRGEGEVTMKELVERGSPEDILGISYNNGGRIVHIDARPPIKDLDLLPFPARHLRRHQYFAMDRSKEQDVILMSRGCRGQCTFCCEPCMSKGHVRFRSPENVMEEILEMVRYHRGEPFDCIFADPDFMSDPQRVERLCDLMKEHVLDVAFTAMVRADVMARYPEVVRKMCEVGIMWFEMGIESPNLRDLKSTKKGITTRVHRQAVKNIRESGGIPGGTFVIGLPDQTAKEIKSFPVYAKEIGLMAAAFGIATPFPGTEFYKELDEKGLIFETNWDKFDEMHSVYKTEHLAKEEIEELATYCMAKFWNLDTLIEQADVFRARNGNKRIPLIDFARNVVHNINFLTNTGVELQGESLSCHIQTFLEALSDPLIETYTRRVGIHNVLEVSRFLRILGPQKIQISLTMGEKTNTSFILKTTRNAVEYVKTTHGKEGDSTIDFEVHLGNVGSKSYSSKGNVIKFLLSVCARQKSLRARWGLFKLMLAVVVQVLVAGDMSVPPPWGHPSTLTSGPTTRETSHSEVELKDG